MPKILAITEEMHNYAKNILAKAGEIQASHGEMARIAGGMTPYYNGTLPELLTQRLLDMKKKHEALYEKIEQYSEKIDYAADNYDWSDQEIAGWAGRLGVGLGILAGGAVTGGTTGTGATNGSTGSNNFPSPNLNSDFYYNDGSNTSDTDSIRAGGKNKCIYREYYDTERMNCTFYSYGRAMEKTGIELKGCVGNGGTWLEQAKTNGLLTGQEIRSNSVAVFGAGGRAGEGHVAFIEDVFEKDGVKYISISEGNGGKRTQDGEIVTKTYEEFLSQWGTPEGYIYTSA
jgi:surface antigen/uncharacterized protein YukE